MNILCAYHAQNPDTCKWVMDNYGSSVGNITVEQWVQACREYLESLNKTL